VSSVLRRSFPIALLFAWIHQLAPEDGALARVTTGKLDWLLIGTLAVVIALVSYEQFAPARIATTVQDAQAGIVAARAAAAGQAVHRHVRGTTATPLGPYTARTRYSAEDPELQLWVHATLVYASLSAYQRFEQQLSAAEQASYYHEMAIVAQLFGVPTEIIPPQLNDFRNYFQAQIEGETICVTPIAREIAQVILDAPLPTPLQMIAPAHRLATAAQLPPALREQYGLRWTALQALTLPIAARSLRLTATPLLLAASHMRRNPLSAAA